MLRRAPSTALRTASDTSFALPVAKPTLPCPSPTATSALKEKRRPPFTTLATRLIAMTFSTSSLPPSPRPPSPRRGRLRPSAAATTAADRRPRPPPPRQAAALTAAPPGPPRPPPPPPGHHVRRRRDRRDHRRRRRPLRAATAATAADCSRCRRLLGCAARRAAGVPLRILVFCHLLELQPAFAGSVGHRFHAAVILVSARSNTTCVTPASFAFGSDPLADFGRPSRSSSRSRPVSVTVISVRCAASSTSCA